MDYAIDDMSRDDWRQVRAIYRRGLATGLAAFMLHPPSWKAWDLEHLAVGRLVTRAGDGAVIGWAALTRVPDT